VVVSASDSSLNWKKFFRHQALLFGELAAEQSPAPSPGHRIIRMELVKSGSVIPRTPYGRTSPQGEENPRDKGVMLKRMRLRIHLASPKANYPLILSERILFIECFSKRMEDGRISFMVAASLAWRLRQRGGFFNAASALPASTAFRQLEKSERVQGGNRRAGSSGDGGTFHRNLMLSVEGAWKILGVSDQRKFNIAL
jgi:hypothetical protein